VDWLIQLGKQVINKNWQARDMVHVWMRDYDIAHSAALRVAECNGDAAGIHGYSIIDEETGQALFQSGASLFIKRTG